MLKVLGHAVAISLLRFHYTLSHNGTGLSVSIFFEWGTEALEVQEFKKGFPLLSLARSSAILSFSTIMASY